MNSLTPVLIVESIEECLPFWIDRLGFQKVVEVATDPSKDAAGQLLGFVILVNGSVEVMLQSRASVELDAPGLIGGALQSNAVGFFIEVDDLAPVRAAIQGCEITLEERTTFYGKREIGVRAPGGFNVIFAAPVEQ